MSQEQKFQVWAGVIAVVVSIAIAFGGVAYASGSVSARVSETEKKLETVYAELNEIRLAINRVDDRTRDADKALARIEGRLNGK